MRASQINEAKSHSLPRYFLPLNYQLLRKLFLLLALPIWTNLISVAEAKTTKIQRIVLTGNRILTDNEIRKIMKTQVGKDFDKTELQEDFDRIVAQFYELGCRFARIDKERLLVKQFDRGLYLHIHIDEGVIGKITVEGNHRTRTEVIVRELILKVGTVYFYDEELESERILRRKSYLSEAEIISKWQPEAMQVHIHVRVNEAWTLIPTLDLPAFSKEQSSMLVRLSESNVFGSGNGYQFRFQQIREAQQKTRNLLSVGYQIPRTFGTHLNTIGRYTQKAEGDSWIIGLSYPLYSLKSKWGADFSISESVDELYWYKGGSPVGSFIRNRYLYSGQVIRSFGTKTNKSQIGLWTNSYTSRYHESESVSTKNTSYIPDDQRLEFVGISMAKQNASFIRTRHLNQMGRIEDIPLGYTYGTKIGRSLMWLGSNRSQTQLSFFAQHFYRSSYQLYLNSQSELLSQIHNGVIEAAILIVSFRLIKKGFHNQSLAIQLSTNSTFGSTSNRQNQVLLGGSNGLRGYPLRRFDGDNNLILNIESRGLYWENDWLILGSIIFLDVGHIWTKGNFLSSRVKRSVGAGLRLSSPKLNYRVYRLEFSYPLDLPGRQSKFPVVNYSVGHLF